MFGSKSTDLAYKLALIKNNNLANKGIQKSMWQRKLNFKIFMTRFKLILIG